MHWRAIANALLRCKEDALIAHLIRARKASPEQGRVAAGLYEQVAENLQEEGRYGDARFMLRLAGLYEANALMNGAVRRADSGGIPETEAA